MNWVSPCSPDSQPSILSIVPALPLISSIQRFNRGVIDTGHMCFKCTGDNSIFVSIDNYRQSGGHSSSNIVTKHPFLVMRTFRSRTMLILKIRSGCKWQENQKKSGLNKTELDHFFATLNFWLFGMTAQAPGMQSASWRLTIRKIRDRTHFSPLRTLPRNHKGHFC